MFRNIIWDVDGTLFDTYPAIAGAILAALRDLGADAPLNQIESLAKVSLSHCFDTLVETCHVDSAQLDQRFDAHYAPVRPEDQPPFPGVIDICQAICSAGGKNVIVTHRGRAGTSELLAAHTMTGYFAGVIARDDGYPRKPDPAAFEAALHINSLSRDETLTVGDRDIDIQAGRAAGLFTCLFDAGAGPDAADLVIGDFGKLSEFLGASPG